jgi:hypothetical protein
MRDDGNEPLLTWMDRLPEGHWLDYRLPGFFVEIV